MAKIIEDEIDLGPGRAPRTPFKYWDKGTMATIGRSKAVAEVGRFKFSGLFAWLTWLFVHLIFLVGFRNKISVLLQWALCPRSGKLETTPSTCPSAPPRRRPSRV